VKPVVETSDAGTKRLGRNEMVDKNNSYTEYLLHLSLICVARIEGAKVSDGYIGW